MIRSTQRGTALVETVIIAFAIVAVAIPVLVAVVRLASARSAVTTEAADVASWTARHGSVPDVIDGLVVEVDTDGHTVRVVVSTEVELLGIGGASVRITVSEEAAATISRFRSNR